MSNPKYSVTLIAHHAQFIVGAWELPPAETPDAAYKLLETAGFDDLAAAKAYARQLAARLTDHTIEISAELIPRLRET